MASIKRPVRLRRPGAGLRTAFTQSEDGATITPIRISARGHAGELVNARVTTGNGPDLLREQRIYRRRNQVDRFAGKIDR